MNAINNKWMRAAIPALLIHCSIGTVYCWSTFKDAIAKEIQVSPLATGWAFSFAIFFLGMSAAFFGKIIERNIKISSLISCICFSVGMIGTGYIINNYEKITALTGVYIFYGLIMGIGLGVGYVTPVKTLMLWFPKQKGLATGISIMGFGLAKAIATPLMEILQKKYGISKMFYILGIMYFAFMFIGHLLLKKPEGWKEETKEDINIKEIVKGKSFIGIWLIFFINIHCGLMLIPYEKQIITYTITGVLISSAVITAKSISSLNELPKIIPSFTAGCNALGRIGYSTISDKMKDRTLVYRIIFISCIISTAATGIICLATNNTKLFLITTIITLFIVNLGYGGGFSTLPALLSEKFGMKGISRIHGMALTAWAVAGITGNNTTGIILNKTNGNYGVVLLSAAVLYFLAFLICIIFIKSKNK